MTGSPRVVRRVERRDHLGRGLQRPDPDRVGSRSRPRAAGDRATRADSAPRSIRRRWIQAGIGSNVGMAPRLPGGMPDGLHPTGGLGTIGAQCHAVDGRWARIR